MSEAASAFKPVRRVVTGHDAGGRSVVLSDSVAQNCRRPDELTRSTLLWSTLESPVSLHDNEDGGARLLSLAPPENGSRFGVLDLAPGNRRFMHRTDTVDYVICLRGQVTMELDDTLVDLKEGDVVIQRGTNHAWLNRSDAPARIAFIMLDGAPKREGPL